MVLSKERNYTKLVLGLLNGSVESIWKTNMIRSVSLGFYFFFVHSTCKRKKKTQYTCLVDVKSSLHPRLYYIIL